MENLHQLTKEQLIERLQENIIVLRQNNIFTIRYDIPTRTLFFPPDAMQYFDVPARMENFPESYVEMGRVVSHVAEFIEFYNAIRRGDPTGKANAEIQISTGEFRLFNRQFTTVYSDDGQPAYGIISITDITAQREQKIAYEKWKYLTTTKMVDNSYYYDYNLTTDTLESVAGYYPSIYPAQNERTFTSVADYVANNIIHPDDREEYLRVFSLKTLREQFACGQHHITTEHRRLGPDGKYFHAQGVIQMYTDPFNGDILCFVLIRNLEEQMENYRAALQSMQFDWLIGNIPGGVIYCYAQPDLPLYYANQKLLELLGYTKEDLAHYVGTSALEFIHPDDREATRKCIVYASANGKDYSIRIRALHKDGTIKWGMLHGCQTEDIDGIPIILSIYTDITETIQLQTKLEEQAAALAEKNSELQALMENIPGGVSLKKMDGNGTLISANPMFFTITGYTPEQARTELDNRFYSIIHPQDLPGVQKSTWDAYAKGSPRYEFEARIIRRDGKTRWIAAYGSFMETVHGTTLYSVTMDITARKELEQARENHEQALMEAVKASEDANRIKSEFLANMSHELRTPLNGILGFSELALGQDGLNPQTHEYLRMIKTSANSLLDMVKDILDLSKITAGKMELKYSPFTLHDIFTQCKSISSASAAEKGLLLYFYAEPYIGKKLVGDAAKLRQVLLNLLSNAIKFTNKGSVKFTATVQKSEPGKVSIYFEVKDTGIGISTDQIQAILRPFSQADASTTRPYGGAGLGLSITERMLELMGGRLSVESTPGQGSKFSFTLSFDTVETVTDAADTPLYDTESDAPPQFSGNVLICEDNALNRRVICDHLDKVGLTATVAANGKLGVDMVCARDDKKHPFDLIFMDIHMPVTDGLEATKIMRDMGVETPIIALTANAMEKDRQIYLDNGMSDYLGKPFKTIELWDCLCKYLDPL